MRVEPHHMVHGQWLRFCVLAGLTGFGWTVYKSYEKIDAALFFLLTMLMILACALDVYGDCLGLWEG